MVVPKVPFRCCARKAARPPVVAGADDVHEARELVRTVVICPATCPPPKLRDAHTPARGCVCCCAHQQQRHSTAQQTLHAAHCRGPSGPQCCVLIMFSLVIPLWCVSCVGGGCATTAGRSHTVVPEQNCKIPRLTRHLVRQTPNLSIVWLEDLHNDVRCGKGFRDSEKRKGGYVSILFWHVGKTLLVQF